MKISITKKVLLYSMSILLVFSCVLTCLFSYFYTKETMNVYKHDLSDKAIQVANKVSGYLDALSQGMMGHSRKELRNYLNGLQEDGVNQIWVFGRNAESIIQGSMHHQVVYQDLPKGSHEMIDAAFEGNIPFSKDFSEMLESKTLSVAAPIFRNQEIVAVVLYHAPVIGIESVIKSSYQIMLFSIVASLILALLYGFGAARQLVRPIKKLNGVAKQLVEGDYEAKSHIISLDEIGALATTLDTLAIRLKEAEEEHAMTEQIRSDFIANLSHELRTPVAIMRATLEGLADGVILESEIEEHVGQLLSESIHLQRLVDDLLEISRLTSSEFKIYMEMIQLNDVVSDCLRGARASAMAKGCQLEGSLEPISVPILGDYSRIRQMITIVLDNAIKFADENTVVKVDLTQTQDCAILAVSDTGLVIKDEELSHLFERFYKTSNHRGGSGLGLAIAKQIAFRHGITIEVVSHEATTFTFFIPLASKDTFSL